VQVVDNDCAVPIFAAFPRVVFLMSTPQKAPLSIYTIYRLKVGTVPIMPVLQHIDYSIKLDFLQVYVVDYNRILFFLVCELAAYASSI